MSERIWVGEFPPKCQGSPRLSALSLRTMKPSHCRGICQRHQPLPAPALFLSFWSPGCALGPCQPSSAEPAAWFMPRFTSCLPMEDSQGLATPDLGPGNSRAQLPASASRGHFLSPALLHCPRPWPMPDPSPTHSSLTAGPRSRHHSPQHLC